VLLIALGFRLRQWGKAFSGETRHAA